MGGAIFGGYLAGLFRKREERLKFQKNELTGKTDLLFKQTQELTRTKDYLHEALTKSDAARVEVEKTKQELEKSNTELRAKIEELEKYGRITVGREMKMMELKSQIKELQEKIKETESRLETDKDG